MIVNIDDHRNLIELVGETAKICTPIKSTYQRTFPLFKNELFIVLLKCVNLPIEYH